MSRKNYNLTFRPEWFQKTAFFGLFLYHKSREFRANQGALWDEISEKADRMEARSPSMAMSAIYERQSGNVEEYNRHFRPIEGQVGAVFLHKSFSN